VSVSLAALRERLGLRLTWLAGGWRREFLLGALVLALLSYSWMYSRVTVPNERSRVYLTVAMVDHGSLSIDEPVRRFGGINDWARRDGRYYTDKAPGSSFLGVVPYAAVRAFSPAKSWTIERLVNLMRTWVMLPLGLLGFFLLRRLLRRCGRSEPTVDLASLGWILGTAAFHYSTAFYGHQIVAVALVGALGLVLDAEQEGARRRWLSMLGAGLLCGVAGLTEYQGVIPCGLLAAYVLAGPLRRHGWALAAFVAGALPGAAALLVYNTLAFGGPFHLSYHYLVAEDLRAIHGAGIGGVTWPHWDYMIGGLFSLHRGFFTTAPLFLLVFPGLYWMGRDRQWRQTAFVGVALLYFLLFISSTKIWFAGWSFGPRLLIPVMGWAMIPVARAIDALRAWPAGDGAARGLALGGVLYCQAVHAVFPELPEGATNPMLDAVLPALRAGVVSPNLGMKWLGLHGTWSLVPLAVLVLAAVAVLLGIDRRRWPARGDRLSMFLAALALLLPLALYCLLHKQGWGPDDIRWFTRDFLQQELARFEFGGR
jgi:hypothetical protein